VGVGGEGPAVSFDPAGRRVTCPGRSGTPIERVSIDRRPRGAGGFEALERLLPSGKYLVGAALLVGVACESPPPVPSAPPSGSPESVDAVPRDTFSAARAFADDVALASLAASGGEGAKAALRAYIASAVGDTGLTVEIQATPEPEPEPDAGVPGRSFEHVVATAAGASPDLFLLVAPLGEAAAGTGVEAAREQLSGAALLLELARVLSTRSLPYTTRFVWIDGEDLPSGSPDAEELPGSRSLAAQLSTRGDLSRIRLLVAFDRVCRADLRVARDLRSERVHREEFFDAAARIGKTQVFARTADYESVQASHLAFRDAGVRAVVALTAARTDDVSPADLVCAPQSLDAVGVVALDALDAIGRRLAKIDRFSRAPLAVEEAMPTIAPEAPPSSAAAPATTGAVSR
jgi:hypothetical protein